MDQLTTLRPGDKVLLAVPEDVHLPGAIEEIRTFLNKEFPGVSFRFVQAADEVKVIFVYRDNGHL